VTLRAGFIGLGNIGKPMASHLAKDVFDGIVYDIDPAPVEELAKKGIKAAKSPREVGEHADVIGICVPEDKHVRAVMHGPDGILAGARKGTIICIHSTIQPDTAIELDAEAQAAGVRVLDCCVTGGDQRAEAGTVTYLVGGEDELVDKVRPYLEASSEGIIHAGALGNGAKLKLCINVVTYIQWAAVYEGYRLAKASGLPDGVFEESGRANGQLTEMQLRYITTHKLPEEAAASEGMQAYLRGHMNTAEKDLAWALGLARSSGTALPVSGLVSQLTAHLYRVHDAGRRG